MRALLAFELLRSQQNSQRRQGLIRLLISVLCIAALLAGCARSPQERYAKYLKEGRKSFVDKDFLKASVDFKNASQALPQEAEPHYQLGLTALASGDSAAAAEYLRQALARNPKHREATLSLADLYARSAHSPTMDEGRRLAQTILSIAPQDSKALNILALLDLRSGNAKAAASFLEGILVRTPNDIETLINLARVRMAQGDRPGAEELLRTAATTLPANATALFALADFHNMAGDSSKAVDSYTRGLQIEPSHGAALMALAKLHVKAGRKQEAEPLVARAAQSPDRRFRFAYAAYLLESGQKDRSVEEFARLLRATPGDRSARTHLVNAYLSSNRVREAEDLLIKAISKNAKDTDALLQRARIHLSRFRPDAAHSDLQMVLEHQRDSPEAHYLIAQVHRLQNMGNLQQQELTEVLRLSPRYLAARLELVRLLTGKDPKGALVILDSAPSEQRQESALRVQRIWPLIELNRIEEAQNAISNLIGLENPEVLLQDAVMRLRRKDFAGSQASAQKALTKNPADVRALELILRSYVGEKRSADGMVLIRHHASQNRSIAPVQLFLGRVEIQAGNISLARAAFEAAKQAAPESQEADWSLIDLDLAERKLDDARHRVTLLLGGPNKAAATAKLGLIEQTAGNYLAASEHYKKVLESNPRALVPLNSLAYILTEFLNKPAEALRYAQAAKEIAPDNAGVDDTLGWTYYRMGLYPGAVRHLELAVKREPTARRHAHLAMAYAKNGDSRRAKQALDQAVKMDPKLPETSQARKVVTTL